MQYDFLLCLDVINKKLWTDVIGMFCSQSIARRAILICTCPLNLSTHDPLGREVLLPRVSQSQKVLKGELPSRWVLNYTDECVLCHGIYSFFVQVNNIETYYILNFLLFNLFSYRQDIHLSFLWYSFPKI